MTDVPLILFGAFDRHNFGDLLLAHVAACQATLAFPNRSLVFAGVAERDLRPYGGHRVRAIAEVARTWGNGSVDLQHVGGEILTCSLYEAAVMTMEPDQAQAAIKRYDGDPMARSTWARSRLELDQEVAYMVPRPLFPTGRQVGYRAVGGVDLPRLPQAMQDEVRGRLSEADRVSVRDRVTQKHLAAWSIQAGLEPDPGERVAELFGEVIARHAATGAPAAAEAAFPQGFLAVQFSADYGDDATLEILAAQLDRVAADTGLGLCLFRAGAAPWHDDPRVYLRLMAFLGTKRVRLFDSLNLWDICALLSRAHAYCGSSLHGRMVSRAFRVPGISLSRGPAQVVCKVRAYAQTWWGAETPDGVAPDEVHAALGKALLQ